MEGLDDRAARLVGQWEAERPDLDLEAAATMERLLHLGHLLDDLVGEQASRYRLRKAELDVLLALCRAGAPYELTPSQLSDLLLVSSGTLTSRLDRLENKELIARLPHPRDRRSMEVQLTTRGREIAEEAISTLVGDGRRIFAALSSSQRANLDRATSNLIDRIAGGA